MKRFILFVLPILLIFPSVAASHVGKPEPGGPRAVQLELADGEIQKEPAVYLVFKEGRAVLRIIDQPGYLTSTATPPPSGTAPPSHPFLSASAMAAEEEHRLRELLDAASSTEDFLLRLREAGYELRQK